MQTNLLITLRGPGALHARLHGELRRAVLDGRLPPGARLPASRALARDLGVSRTVVVQAYERLCAEGWLEARVGAGTFVPHDLRLPPDGRARSVERGPPRPPARLSAWGSRLGAGGALPRPETGLRFDFRYGRPDAPALPLGEWRRIVGRHAARPPTAYADPRGSLRLRRALAGYLARGRGVRADPDRILVCTGSQQALDLTARVLLDPGDAVVLEEPHYRGARRVLDAAGARLLPVATDEHGLVPRTLPAEHAVRLVVVTPSHQFPSGGVLPLGRRLELLAWARERNAVVLEDDYDGEFRYDADPVEAIQALDVEGRVVYVGTLSKVLFPGLRLGYLVLPPDLVEAFTEAKWLTDRHSPLLEQEALATLLDEGAFERHLRRCRLRYARRREALLEAVAHHLPRSVRVQGASAGLHVVLWLPGVSATRVHELLDAARRRAVGVYPVAPYYLVPPPEAGLVIGYSALAEADIAEGVRRLGEALAEWRPALFGSPPSLPGEPVRAYP
jgi:GntR family transcriptional regulator/MocR family aminotransferase